MLSSKAYAEVYYIINQMSEKMKSKIPENIIKNIKERMDKNYIFNSENKDLENIELLEDTEKILSVLYTDYFSTEEEKEIILNKEKMLESERKDKGFKIKKVNDIFANNDKDNDEKNIEKDGLQFSNKSKIEIKKLLKNLLG